MTILAVMVPGLQLPEGQDLHQLVGELFGQGAQQKSEGLKEKKPIWILFDIFFK